MKKSFFEKIYATQVLPTGVKSGEWYFFKWAQSSFSDKQIRTASKNTECFVENALAMLNIRVMTHPRSPFMVRQAHQPGGSGRRTESGFADAASDWSRLANRAVPVAGPGAGSRTPSRTGAGSPAGGSGRWTESGFAEATSDWSGLTNRAVPVAGPRAGSRTPSRTGAGSPTWRFRSPDRERVCGCHLGLEQARQPGGSGRWTESGFADAFSDWSRLTNRAVPVAGPRAGSRMPPRTGAGSPTGRFRSLDLPKQEAT